MGICFCLYPAGMSSIDGEMVSSRHTFTTETSSLNLPLS